MARRVLLVRPMEHRNGHARSAMESLARRQLEARRLSESSPIAGLGTYQVMRPTRGREVVRPRAPVRRPARVPDSSNTFGTVEIRDLPLEAPPRAARQTRVDDRAMMTPPRLDRAEIAPPPREEMRRTGWLLPMTLAALVSTVLLTLALVLR